VRAGGGPHPLRTPGGVLPPLSLAPLQPLTGLPPALQERGDGNDAGIALVMILIAVSMALPAAAGPAELFLGDGAAALAVGGSWAPAPLLGEARADFPTTLHLPPRAQLALEVGAQAPLTLRTGRREYGEVTAHASELRLDLPAEASGDRAWRLGVLGVSGGMEVRHRLRRDTTELTIDVSALSLGAAWSGGRWTLGAAHTEHGPSGCLAGPTVARFQHVRLGTEGIACTGEGEVDALAAEFGDGTWRLGAQIASGHRRTSIAADVRRTPCRGLLADAEERRDAWLVAGPERAQWFAWASEAQVDPRPSALLAGEVIRGRASVGARSSTWGVGRRCGGSRVYSRTELSGRRDAGDVSAYVNRGALGSLSGQDRGEAEVRFDSLALRWAEERRDGPWRYRYALAALRTRIDFHGRVASADGPFGAPEVTWEQRLDDGEAWLGAAVVGAGYAAGDWRTDASFAALFGDFDGVLTDLTTPAPPGTPGHPQPRPAPEPGPGTRLDPGWLLAVSFVREL